MREQVFAAVIRRNEAVALRVVEPLHGACCHTLSLIVDLSYRAFLRPEPCLNHAPPPPLVANRRRIQTQAPLSAPLRGLVKRLKKRRIPPSARLSLPCALPPN